tara:strand:+ start:50 stop:919 length:870 start_codon:yes stop_codon:yes gene_type:complete
MLIQKSFQDLYKHPIVFVPDLVMALIDYFLLTVLYSYVGFNEIVSELPSDLGSQADMITSFISANTLQVIISVSMFVILTFLIGVGVMIIRFNLIKQIVNGKKPSIWEAWKIRNKFYYRVVILRALVYLISIVALIAVILTSSLVYLLINPFSTLFATYFSLMVAIIVSITLLLLLKWFLLFRYPLMFLTKRTNPLIVLRNCVRYFKKNPALVIFTWLIVFAVSVLFTLVIFGFNMVIPSLLDLVSFATLATILYIIYSVFTTTFGLIPDLWQSLYLFYTYKEKPLKKP